MSKFQKDHVGDTEIQTSAWKKDEDGAQKSRTISFTHPIPKQFGVGPFKALVKKEQRLRRYGDLGISVESVSHISGPPGSDAFCVCDGWIVEKGEGKQVLLTVLYGVEFIKSSWIKSWIEKSTTAEVTAWYRGYESMLLDACRQSEPQDDAKTRGDVSITTTNVTRTGEQGVASVWVVVLIALLVVCLQNWYFQRQMYFMRQEMNTQLQDLRELLVVVKTQLEHGQECPLVKLEEKPRLGGK